MSNAVVIYKSNYGATKQYAEWIAAELDAVLFEASRIKPAQLMDYDVVIYGGAIYAGGINGVKLVTENPCKKLVVFVVGASDPETTDFSETINRNFTEDFLLNTKVFHLRGGIDYDKLGLLHRFMMAAKRMMVKNKNEADLASDERLVLETYGRKADFVDRSTIAPIIACISNVE